MSRRWSLKERIGLHHHRTIESLDAQQDTATSHRPVRSTKRAMSRRRPSLGSFGLFLGLLFVVVGLFRIPAWAASKGPKTLTAGQSCVSGSCHQAQVQGKFTHGTSQKPLCTGCHKQDDPKLHQFSSQSTASCASCHASFHQQTMSKAWGFVHGPVAAAACGTCHDPHQSQHKHLLKKEGNALCLNCHRDVSRAVPSQKSQHPPWKKQLCLNCHSPHGSKQQSLMRSDVAEVCLSCHTTVKKQLSSQNAHHGALMKGRKCLNCHQGHASTHGSLLRMPSASLCLSCHSREIPRFGQRKLTDIHKALQSKYRHQPLQKGRCQDCHTAHGASFPKLLTKAHPAGLYADYQKKKYDLCFSCHQEGLVSSKQTLTSTNFRNGAFNLHWLHVNRKKGRSCRFCHDAHATQQPHLIRKRVTFGQWKLPIGFQASKEGGKCAASCHQSRTYRREKPIEQGYERYKDWLKAPASLQRNILTPKHKQRTSP